MHSRTALIYLLTASVMIAPGGASAQRAPAGTSPSLHVPVEFRLTVPTQRPSLTLGRLAAQTGWGLVGGLAGAAVVGLPLMLAGWGSGDPLSTDAAAALMGVAYVAGTTVGIHHGGRNEEMRANPFATAGGVVVGLIAAAATLRLDDEGYAEPNLFFFVAPAIGGTAGYALTRAVR